MSESGAKRAIEGCYLSPVRQWKDLEWEKDDPRGM